MAGAAAALELPALAESTFNAVVAVVVVESREVSALLAAATVDEVGQLLGTKCQLGGVAHAPILPHGAVCIAGAYRTCANALAM